MKNDAQKDEQMSPRKPKNFMGTLKRLMAYMSTRVWGLILVLLLTITSTILMALTPKILGQATTEIFSGFQEGMALRDAGQIVDTMPINFDLIGQVLGTVFVMYLASGVFSYFQQFVMARIGQLTVYDLRKDFKEKMGRLPISYYDTHSNGDIMSRAVNDMDQIANTLQQSLTQFVQSIVQFIAVLAMMLSISIQLTVVAFIIVILSGTFVYVIAPRSQKMFAKQQKELGILNNQVEETYSGHAVVKIYNHEETEIEKFEKQNEEYYDASWKAQFLTGLMMPLISFAKNIGYLAVAVLGGIAVATGTLSLGNVQAFLQYVGQFSQPMRNIANLSNLVQETIASAERIFEVLDEPEMEEIVSNVKPIPNAPYKIQFEHVQFGYGGPDEPLLMNDFSLDVKEGEMIAIVGPTGAGKSTLINLLERFYDINGGSIKLDGVDVRDYTRDDLRSHFAMVLQDTWLFNGTILENLKYGNEALSDSKEDLLAAAEAAHVDEFVRKLPHGYNTVLNEEASNISQGQRQLITIARALFADPEVLILDEATSSVDTRTEVLIQKAMEKLLKGRTSFVIAHRLSTIRDADKIIVMNHGDVMETGTHDELMAKEGFYADLYNAQFTEETA